MRNLVLNYPRMNNTNYWGHGGWSGKNRNPVPQENTESQ